MTEITESIREDGRVRDNKQQQKLDWRNKTTFIATYGWLYEDNNSGTSLVLPTAGSFVKWASSTFGAHSGIGFVVADAGDDDITIGAGGEGTYKLNIAASFSGSNNANIHGAVFKNGFMIAGSEWHRKLTGNDLGNAGMPSMAVDLVDGDVLDYRFTSDTNSTTLTLEHVSIRIERVP